MVALVSEDKELAHFFYELFALNNYKFTCIKPEVNKLSGKEDLTVALINLDFSHEPLFMIVDDVPHLPLIILTRDEKDLEKHDNPIHHHYFLKENLKLQSLTNQLKLYV